MNQNPSSIAHGNSTGMFMSCQNGIICRQFLAFFMAVMNSYYFSIKKVTLYNHCSPINASLMSKRKADSETIVLPTHYVRQIIHQVQKASGDEKKILRGLSQKRLKETEVCFASKEFGQFIRRAERLGGSGIGLLVGQALLVNTHGSLGYVMMNSGSIRQCMEVLEVFLPLRIRLVYIHSQVKDNCLCVTLKAAQSLGDIERLIFEAVLAAIKNVMDYVTMGAQLNMQVMFSFPENTNTELAQSIFGNELLYDQPRTGFVLPLDEADKPLLVSDKDSFEQAIALCRQELEQLDEDMPLSKKIECLIANGPKIHLTIEQVAHTFDLSERTLYRMLEKENVRFTEIIEKVKYQVAMEHLASGLKMKEIALLLGYRYAPNFHRAFGRWKKQYAE